MLTPTGLLWHWRYWWRHLLAIHKSLILFQIVFYGAMDLAPLLCVIRALEMPLLLPIRGLLASISTISWVSCVDFLIVLLLL
jgi:hypothetical protein